jgi:DNA polymerase I
MLGAKRSCGRRTLMMGALYDRINGDKSGAIEGVVRLLKRLDDLHQPQHICVFFDQPQQKTARKILDPTYKSNRRSTPQTLRPQLRSAPSLLRSASINCMTCTGIEADDMIASYTSALFTRGYDVLIVSNDNDFLQLARGERRTKDAKEADPGPTAPTSDGETAPDAAAPYVEIYQMNKRRYLRERHIRSRFSVPPWQLPDFFALCGISWGKLPRVEGVTDDIAVELLTKYGSLPRLLRNLDEIEDPVLRKTLKHSIGHIESAYRISKLVDHYALPSAIEELVVPRFDGFPQV